MGLQDLLAPDGVLVPLKATSKKQLLQELSDRAAAQTSLEARVVFDALLERERLGTTGVGDGVAIPHARLAGIERVQAFFARLEKGVDFDAVDDAPVDLVFLLLAPEEAGADHLKALAKISRRMRDPDMRETLRGASNAAAIHALLTETPARAA